MAGEKRGGLTLLGQDMKRYPAHEHMPAFQRFYRKAQMSRSKPMRLVYKALFKLLRDRRFIELSADCRIGGGLYLGHAYCITINPNTRIGRNVNIHKGVTIGQENRGTRKGAPAIGDEVWIGVNSTIVGNVTIGSDVLIAPNTYVNCDIPPHSVVFGNPCVIKRRDDAVRDYINRKAELD